MTLVRLTPGAVGVLTCAALASVMTGCGLVGNTRSSSGSTSGGPHAAALPAVPKTCAVKPSPRTTGAHGALKASTVTEAKTGQTIENVRLSTLDITGSDVTVRNVRVDGRILVTGDDVVLDHVTSKGVSVSSGMNTVVEYNDIGFAPADSMHVTSDGGRYIHGTVIRYNYIHDPRPPKSEHADGLQVRGVDTMAIVCNNFQGGPWQSPFNAAIYLEDANGGDKNVTVAKNWLFGFAWTFMTGATNSRFEDNIIGGDIHWGTCYNMPPGMTFTSRGNVSATGRPIRMCPPTPSPS